MEEILKAMVNSSCQTGCEGAKVEKMNIKEKQN